MRQEFADYLILMSNLTDEGKLPDNIFPRFAYCGHEVINTFSDDDGIQAYKCITCNHIWPSHKGREQICPSCSQEDNSEYGVTIFNITPQERTAKWRCKDCKHEWVAEDGTTCPACKSVRND